jgi:hypothetical protein
LIAAMGRQCGACGGAGQPCCGTGNNGSCSAGFACTGRDDNMGMPGMCGPCGGTGQLCCPGGGGGGDGGTSPCMTGFSCLLTATTNQCGTCGASGQPCCGTGNTGTCEMGFGCAGRLSSMRMPGTCGVCGALGQACCSGGGATACTAGLACRMMMCADVSDGGAVDAPADLASGQ